MRMSVIVINFHNCATRNTKYDTIGKPHVANATQFAIYKFAFDEHPHVETGEPVLAACDLVAPMLCYVMS